jgi:hypothetical protein
MCVPHTNARLAHSFPAAPLGRGRRRGKRSCGRSFGWVATDACQALRFGKHCVPGEQGGDAATELAIACKRLPARRLGMLTARSRRRGPQTSNCAARWRRSWQTSREPSSARRALSDALQLAVENVSPNCSRRQRRAQCGPVSWRWPGSARFARERTASTRKVCHHPPCAPSPSFGLTR